jgi:hypothetical protein
MKPKKALKAKLIICVMFANDDSYSKVLKELTGVFGETDDSSLPYDFTMFSNYYEKEMGKIIKKRFITFKRLIQMERHADIKILTNKIEDKFAENGKRTVNLDPGYVTPYSIVLASAKPRSNKIYLKKGIYADMVMNFSKNRCIVLPTTFKDFQDEKNQDFFMKIRNKLINELKG